VIGGIYSGIFTPNEAAAIEAFVAMLLAIQRRTLSLSALCSSLADSVRPPS